MRVTYKRLALCLLAASLTVSLHAQQPEPVALPTPTSDLRLHFEHFGVNDGLSQSGVTSIFQDHLGFLWFGTMADGLNRFDGVSFTHFKTIPFDTTSISANADYQDDPLIPFFDDFPIIWSITEDRSGHLWVGTRIGLDRFDRATETFTRFAHDPDDTTSLGPGMVLSVKQDRTGGLWVGTWGGGLSRMDPEQPGHFTRYRHDPADSTSLSSDTVFDLYEDKAGTLWVGTANGLNRMDPDTPGHFTHYLHSPGAVGVGIWRMVEDAEEAGVLWMISSSPHDERSLLRFDSRTGVHQRYDLGGAAMRGVASDPARPGVLWLATAGQGLYRFETQTGHYQRFQHDAEDADSLPADVLMSIYADRTGSMWVGTTVAGLALFEPSAGSFAHYNQGKPDPVFGLLEDQSGGLWMGGEEGLSRLDRMTGYMQHWRHDPADPTSLRPESVSTIYEDRLGVIWINTWSGGLSRMDRATGRFTHFLHAPADSTSLGPGGSWAITEDREGTLWIGTSGGLSRMDRATGRFTRFLHDPADSTSLGPGTVFHITEDREGSLWITTSSGLSRMDRARETFAQFLHDPNDPTSVSPNYAGSVFEDRSGTLWVGTSGGLARMDRATGHFTHFTEQNSDLPNNAVMGILEDDAGYLWLSTNGGLSRFDPRSETFRNFDHSDGLRTLEYTPGGFKSPRTGELFFGDHKGVTAFYPHHFETNTHPPLVTITDLKLFNESVSVGDGSPLTRPISETEHIELRHDENAVSFDFVALHYKNAGQNQYRYKLEPYEADWVEAGTQRMARYTNLPPDEYVFRVKAANSDGVWNEEGASLSITILPPWWGTWWAYAIYGLLFAAGVFAVDRFQRRRLLRKEREKAELREKDLRAEAAEAMANYLQSENLRQTQELDAARELQLSMLPEALPEHPTVKLAAFMQTATEVGGDYYDFDLADDGTLTLAIGDATGHGTKAGTMVTAAKSLFIHCAREPDLAAVLHESTRTLKRMGLPKLYMALALARVRDHTLELAGAGMPPALVYRAAAQQVETVALKGMPLGGPLAFPYRKTRLRLSPGDTVMLMSDGFPELFNAEGKMLGYERAVEVFAEVASRPPEEIIAHFRETGETWAQGWAQDDDVTFVVMKVKAESESA